jgi:hypothetical protein
MATKKSRKKTTNRAKVTRGRTDTGGARLQHISKSSSQIVKDAAALLDEEMAAGILAAKQVQQRFRKEKRIDPSDFREALQKFQGHAHEVINQLNERLSETSAQENAELIGHFVTNTHDLLDLTVEMVNTSAEIADRLLQSDITKKLLQSDLPKKKNGARR